MDRDALVQRLRGRIHDERVLEAIAAVPRELFVAPALARFAYHDRPLPISAGQTISQPTVVARMCAWLELRASDRVLDVGTGSGYHAAVMSRLCAHVWGVELEPQLVEAAVYALRAAGIDNVTVVVGDGTAGLPEHAPYDAINVAATAHGGIPAALVEQLADGGRLIAPVGNAGEERLVLVQRHGGELRERALDAVRFVPLR